MRCLLVFTCCWLSRYLFSVEGKLSCKNQKGKDVDWFLLYKIPKTKALKENFMQPRGGEYAYVDGSSTSKFWSLNTNDDGIYSQHNPMAYTIKPLAEESQNIAHLVYNDQPPPPHNKTKGGHTKGALMYDGQHVVWILHSVPQFLRALHKGKYIYPDNGRENGQVMMCVTFPAALITLIAEHLLIQRPFIYDVHGFDKLTKKYDILLRLLAPNYRKERGGKLFAVDNLRSAKGVTFTSISKSPKRKTDVYSELATKYASDSQYVETWRNGAGRALASTCRGMYSIVDVDTVKLWFSASKSIEFNYREDHSKWAVSFSKPIFCMSSLNRMESQFERGGGMLCIHSTHVAKLFRNSVKHSVPCGKKKSKS